MPDLNLTPEGDLTISHNGDLAMVPSQWHNYSQQAYIRLMTPISDFAVYPFLGADLDSLIGMPQSPETGEYGKALISAALDREGVFTGVSYQINAVPVSAQAIRFDVFVTAGSRTSLILSVEQNLGIT